jgi:hypothetical protein
MLGLNEHWSPLAQLAYLWRNYQINLIHSPMARLAPLWPLYPNVLSV